MTSSTANDDFEEDAWDVIDRYFQDRTVLLSHQFSSFDSLMSTRIPEIIDSLNPIEVYDEYDSSRKQFGYNISVNIVNPRYVRLKMEEPDGSETTITPMIARLRQLSYAANLVVDLKCTFETYNPVAEAYHTEHKEIINVCLGKIPIMVRSSYCVLSEQPVAMGSECAFDYGGYFIIQGTEKVLVSQDRLAENKVQVFVNTKSTPYISIAEVRSIALNGVVPKTTAVKLSSKETAWGFPIRATVHHVKVDVPISVVFKAFGIVSDQDVLALVCSMSRTEAHRWTVRNLMIPSIQEGSEVRTQHDALSLMSRNLNVSGYVREQMSDPEMRIEILKKLLKTECLPHCGNSFRRKAIYLAFMTNKLVSCYGGLQPYDDRDSYVNKKVDCAGQLLGTLIKQYLSKVVKDFKCVLIKEIHTATAASSSSSSQQQQQQQQHHHHHQQTATTTAAGAAAAASSMISNNKTLSSLLTKQNILRLLKPATLAQGLTYALSTGNWHMRTSTRPRPGVAQVLNRINYLAILSHLRRVMTSIEKSGRLVTPRNVHATNAGIICPCETPEGASVGLVKNLAMMANITCASSPEPLTDILLHDHEQDGSMIFLEDCTTDHLSNLCHVTVNGDIKGVHTDPIGLFERLKEVKRRGGVNPMTSIVLQPCAISINTDSGRCTRPLFIVDSGNVLRFHVWKKRIQEVEAVRRVTWMELVLGCTDGSFPPCIEYLDIEEQNASMIAMKVSDLRSKMKGGTYPPQFTHCEIHPCLMLGVAASCIPFCDHNQSPRNCYQASMCKQAIGVHLTNHQFRFDSISHVLVSPHVPIVQTRMGKILNSNELPCGQNVVVAIACFGGYNQEDALIMNRSSVQRGMFHTMCYKSHKETNMKNHSSGQEEVFCNPKIGVELGSGYSRPVPTENKPFNYDKLDRRGFVPVNTHVTTGDIIIGKVLPSKHGEAKDISVALKVNEGGFVDKVHVDSNGDGYMLAKVRIRNMRVPVVGDKFASRHAQKGTVGILYDSWDMPFTSDGVTPDIIINPNCIPSRMTIGQILEMVVGNIACTNATFADGTPFNSAFSMEDLKGMIHDHNGDETLFNPVTGEKIPTKIFMGICYYQRLKHMTCDKVHSRGSNGPVVLLTRQPSDGRSRAGGLRIGTMEMECMCCHGCSGFIKERAMECSDNFEVVACSRCGAIGDANRSTKSFFCRMCNNRVECETFRIPYACKLLLQELGAMSIGARFNTVIA